MALGWAQVMATWPLSGLIEEGLGLQAIQACGPRAGAPRESGGRGSMSSLVQLLAAFSKKKKKQKALEKGSRATACSISDAQPKFSSFPALWIHAHFLAALDKGINVI